MATFTRSQALTSKGSETSFGELSVAEPTAIVQIGFPYNLNTQIVEVRDNGGSSSVSGGLVSLSTGAATNQSSQILSRNPIKYNHGQGGLFRGTAIFTQGVAGSEQMLGIGDLFDGLFFGYAGADFVVRKTDSGKPEVRTLTVTTASSTAENITITLDGDAKSDVTVTASADTTVTANEIAAADYSAVGDGWVTEAVGDTVIFESWTPSAKSGTYTLSGATTAVGTFAQTLAGADSTNTDVAQTSWNVDKMDGFGASAMKLDPTQGNVYQIRYQWLGFGMIRFYIEDADKGEFAEVHRIEYANANTTPSIQNPTLPICLRAKNTTNSTDIVVQSASLGGFVEGKDEELGVLTGTSGESTTLGTTEVPILSIRNKIVFQSQLNRVKAILETISVSTDSSAAVKIRVLENPTLVGSSWSDVSANTSIAQADTSATSCTGGVELFAFNMGKTDTQIIDVDSLKLSLLPANHVTVTAEALAGTNQTVVVSLNWKELL